MDSLFRKRDKVIFVAAISEFDQVLYEDEGVNRLEESINVFDEVCNNKYFDQTAVILFLNKMDLFTQKLVDDKVQLSRTFPDFKGPNSVEVAAEFIKEKFIDVNKNTEKMIFCHLTCATDTENVQVVFEACKRVIVKANLTKLGIL